jgi:hypothetical protein
MNIIINKLSTEPLRLKVSDLYHRYIDIKEELKKYVVKFSMVNEANGVHVVLNRTAELHFVPYELTNTTNATEGEYWVVYRWSSGDTKRPMEGKCVFTLINTTNNEEIELPSQGELTISIV